MKFRRKVTIRPLGPADAANFLRVHHAAVHATASHDYPPEVLDAWSGPISDARIARYNSSADEEIRIGAFDGTTLAGLGCIAPLQGELRACYVHPDYGRMGVGRKLVDALEQIATGMGLNTLTLDSSITAEHFYTQLGYAVVSRGSHRLEDGSYIASIKMQKSLTSLDEMDAMRKKNAQAKKEQAWESSWVRHFAIAALIVLVLTIYLPTLRVNHVFWHAVIPAGGYLLSVIAMRELKEKWLKNLPRDSKRK
ncbi:MAG: GNAT family N-acetyltransferase [Rhodospirillales bacterium]|nr:GNAT family N-acetyltransferase [Alphaproteobacteria bacterium]MCB9986776.1 GNAT family N-acetyltransferase [Rhodospirillales bacterium]USO08454.1 MAG: GNAT family N-acetyltransferase [Rhodospirillales bacterium]